MMVVVAVVGRGRRPRLWEGYPSLVKLAGRVPLAILTQVGILPYQRFTSKVVYLLLIKYMSPIVVDPFQCALPIQYYRVPQRFPSFWVSNLYFLPNLIIHLSLFSVTTSSQRLYVFLIRVFYLLRF